MTKTEQVVVRHTDSIYVPVDKIISTVREKKIYDTVDNIVTVVQVELDTVYMDTCHVLKYRDSSNNWVNLSADIDLCTKSAKFVYTSKFDLPRYSLFSLGGGYLFDTKNPFIYGEIHLSRMEFGIIKGWDDWGVYVGRRF